ncbi:hypothetical protein [Enterococcus gallinarum]|uniref:hypothetical protein n=1 Tax=Enterococcus gallinarum TaxID=1353 RepID=UPI00115D870B|nr:hypothetical protein [Enterococcus gallinarum]MCD5076657.1 hypothetical protein [Enterococcus gallinarum]
MREIYYPSFEINDEKWLKHAILYKDNVTTIVPKYFQKNLSDEYKEIYSQSDLLSFYDLSQEDIEIISDTAMTVSYYFDDVYNNPLSYPIKSYWEKYKYLNDLLINGRKPYTLVSQKINSPLENNLIKKGYAVKTANGIKVHYIIGFFYMNILASKLASKYENYVATTDINSANYIDRILNSYLPTFKASDIYFEKDEVKQLIINQSIPNLDRMSLSDAIAIRNKRNYTNYLESFNKVIEEIITCNDVSKLDLKEVDRQLTFYSDEMSGIREDFYRKYGRTVVFSGISYYTKNPLFLLGTECLRSAIDSPDKSNVKLRDVLKTKRIIANLRKINV